MQNEPYEKKYFDMTAGGNPAAPSLGGARAVFSKLGLSATLMLASASVVQVLLVRLLNRAVPGWTAWPYSMWLLGFGVLYVVSIPAGLLLTRRMSVLPPEKNAMTLGRYLCILLICIFMMEAGNLVGLAIQSLMESIVGGMPENPIEVFATDDSLPLRILFLVILAPLIEEFVFRRVFIDRMRPYGEKLAVVTSALMFGLFHGNLSQMFYAFALGLVFGYVYLRTGKLRYSVGLHMFINFFGGVLSVELTKWAQPGLEAAQDPNTAVLTPGVVALSIYSIALLGCAVAGLVLLCVRSRRVYFEPTPLEVPQGQRFSVSWINVGMLLFLALSAASVVMTYAG